MVVRYKGGSQYVCNHLRQQHDVPECQCLRAAPIDYQIAAAFLEAVAPAEIEALAKARNMGRRADDALRHAQEQQIQCLRYKASLAERQFNRVDPDNRLVAAELEGRWEEALLELRQAEETLKGKTDASLPEPLGIDSRLRAKVVALGARLPAIWVDRATPREHRKALLRCLIDKVIMRRGARDRTEVRIVWPGVRRRNSRSCCPSMGWPRCRARTRWNGGSANWPPKASMMMRSRASSPLKATAHHGASTGCFSAPYEAFGFAIASRPRGSAAGGPRSKDDFP